MIKKDYKEFILKKYGQNIELKGIISQTLNTFCIRGFEKIDILGISSSADVLDQELKTNGSPKTNKGQKFKKPMNTLWVMEFLKK